MANPNGGPPEHRFKPGQSGNPGGLAVGTRNRLNARFLNALADDFQEHGKEAIERTRIEEPGTYVKVCASLLPKQIEQTQPLDDLNDADLMAVLEYLRGRLAAGSGKGTQTPPESTTTQ